MPNPGVPLLWQTNRSPEGNGILQGILGMGTNKYCEKHQHIVTNDSTSFQPCATKATKYTTFLPCRSWGLDACYPGHQRSLELAQQAKRLSLPPLLLLTWYRDHGPDTQGRRVIWWGECSNTHSGRTKRAVVLPLSALHMCRNGHSRRPCTITSSSLSLSKYRHGPGTLLSTAMSWNRLCLLLQIRAVDTQNEVNSCMLRQTVRLRKSTRNYFKITQLLISIIVHW